MSEDDCFAGAINSKDAGFGKILEKNCRMNLGRFMLTILLYKVCDPFDRFRVDKGLIGYSSFVFSIQKSINVLQVEVGSPLRASNHL